MQQAILQEAAAALVKLPKSHSQQFDHFWALQLDQVKDDTTTKED
jgi:hypothetical protein